MNQKTFEAGRYSRGHCNIIEAILKERAGEWVGLLELHEASRSQAVHSRISELRKKRDLTIEHHNKICEGGILSFYKLTGSGDRSDHEP